MVISIIDAVVVAALGVSGGAWHYQTINDPLGQTVHVAEIAPDEARPFVAMRLMCGGISGVSLQVNLGQMQYASADSSPATIMNFNLEGAPIYTTAALLAPVADGIGTFEIKGSEAGNVAHLLLQSKGAGVAVSVSDESVQFPLTGASLAIGEVIANCPFKI